MVDIFDAHTHIFPLKVVENVRKRTAMVKRLGLQTQGVEIRTLKSSLEHDLSVNPLSAAWFCPRHPPMR